MATNQDAEPQTLLDAAENAVIAFGMGWEMEGVMQCLQAVITRDAVLDAELAADPAIAASLAEWERTSGPPAGENSPAAPSLEWVRGFQAARSQAAAMLNEASANLRRADEDTRGIPAGMGVSWIGDELDAQAGRVGVMQPEGGADHAQ